MQLNRERSGTILRSAVALGLSAVAALSGAAAAPSAPAGTAQVPIAWQHHQASFSYFGITTLYVCDALEAQVTRILKYLGARADLKVRASCAQPRLPTSQAVIYADFYSPVLADGGIAGGGTAAWTAVGMESGHPNFIDAGDCELIDDMKELVTANFSLRNLDYSTSCFPHDLTLHDFGVKGEALKATAPARG